MGKTVEPILKFGGDAAEAVQASKKTAKSIDKLEGSIKQSTTRSKASFKSLFRAIGKGRTVIGRLTRMITKPLAMIGGGLSLYTILSGRIPFVTGAIQQEKILMRLKRAVEVYGKSWADVYPEIEYTAHKLQDFTNFGDTETYGVLERLLDLTKDYDQAMAALVPALTFAEGAQFDLTGVFEKFGMAIKGETGELAKYGIVVDQSIPKSERFKEVLRQIMATYQDTAFTIKKLDPFPGLSNEIGDVSEKIGDVLLPSVRTLGETLSRKLRAIKLNLDIKVMGGKLGELFSSSSPETQKVRAAFLGLITTTMTTGIATALLSTLHIFMYLAKKMAVAFVDYLKETIPGLKKFFAPSQYDVAKGLAPKLALGATAAQAWVAKDISKEQFGRIREDLAKSKYGDPLVGSAKAFKRRVDRVAYLQKDYQANLANEMMEAEKALHVSQAERKGFGAEQKGIWGGYFAKMGGHTRVIDKFLGVSDLWSEEKAKEKEQEMAAAAGRQQTKQGQRFHTIQGFLAQGIQRGLLPPELVAQWQGMTAGGGVLSPQQIGHLENYVIPKLQSQESGAGYLAHEIRVEMKDYLANVKTRTAQETQRPDKVEL